MSNPSSRGSRCDAAEAPTMLRSARSFMSSAAPPGDPARVEAERVAPVDVVVDHRGQQVVGRGDGVEIAGEVQVDLLHRRDLRPPPPVAPPLMPKQGPRLGSRRQIMARRPMRVQRIAEPDRGGGLALAGRRRADAGDQHQRAVRPVLPRSG